MISYCYPKAVNNKYWIRKIIYKCKNCKKEFFHELPLDNDAVKLIGKDRTDIKWLPTLGVGGYLDLINKLVPEFNGKEITGVVSMKISRIMQVELPKYTEKEISGNGYRVGGYEHICPNCKSKDLKEINEEIIENVKLDWVKISCDLLK